MSGFDHLNITCLRCGRPRTLTLPTKGDRTNTGVTCWGCRALIHVDGRPFDETELEQCKRLLRFAHENLSTADHIDLCLGCGKDISYNCTSDCSVAAWQVETRAALESSMPGGQTPGAVRSTARSERAEGSEPGGRPPCEDDGQGYCGYCGDPVTGARPCQARKRG